MTNYGTIPTSSSPDPSSASNLQFISRAKERMISGLAARRPWKQMVLPLHSFAFPHGFADSISRIRTNISYFLMNYAIIVLTILFLSLLWHPISLIVFIIMMAAWLFLYFLRDEPLVILHRTIGDRVVLSVLTVVTIVALLLTRVTLNVLISLLVGVVIVLLHAAVRKTDDLDLDEETGLVNEPLTSSSSS